jgi:small subunit ribosomal protein S6
MREYELLYVVSGSLSEDEAAKATDAVNDAIIKLGGKVGDENVWGRRRLAYQIAKQEHGWYVVSRISLEGDKMADLSNALRLNDQVIRTLIVGADEVPTAEEAAKALKAAEESEKERASRRDPAKPEPKAPTPKPEEEPVEEPKPAKKETAAERKARQAKIEEKLGELLNEE